MNNEKYIQENKENWAREVVKGRLIYPDENVIRFLVARRKGNYQNKVVLDFGCGAGRHSLAMLNMGYKVIGMDYNKECLDLTEERVKELFNVDSSKEKFVALQNSGVTLELEDSSLDYIVAWGSLFYNGREIFRKMLHEMNRVLNYK